MSSPQVTAKMNLDAKGVKVGTGEVQREFAKMGASARSSMASAMRGVLAPIGAAVTATIGAALGKGLRDGVQQAFKTDAAEVLMKSTLGSVEKMREAMALVNKEAADNPMFSKSALADAAGSLSNYAQGSVRELEKLMHTAKLLSVLNPEQGIQGAAYSLKEALGGDYVSLAERFNISKTSIRDFKAQGLSGRELVDAVIKAQGITDATLRDLAGTRESQMQGMFNQLTNIGQQFFDTIWPELQPQLQAMQDWMKANGTDVVASLKVIADTVGIIARTIAGALGVWDKVTGGLADLIMGGGNPLSKAINQAVSGTAAIGGAVQQFSAGNLTGQQAAQYVQGSMTGAQPGTRTQQAMAAGLVINVTGNGVSAQMGNT